MSDKELRLEILVSSLQKYGGWLCYYSAFVADEPAISHTVENLLYRNHSTEYFILLEMCYKERCIFNQIHDDAAVSWSACQI